MQRIIKTVRLSVNMATKDTRRSSTHSATAKKWD